MQDLSRPPSPSAGIGAITLGEPAGDTPPAGQSTCLVTERVIEPGDDAPTDEQHTELECEGDIVDLYMGTEEL